MLQCYCGWCMHSLRHSTNCGHHSVRIPHPTPLSHPKIKIYSFKQLCQLILVPLNTLKTCTFPYFSSIQDSKLVHYIRKFVITEFVIPIKFYKDLWRILPGTRKNFAMCETSLNPCSHYKRIYCMQWRMPKIPPQTITVSQRISEQPFLMVIQVYI